MVLSLADWRAERSYLWSVFVGELVEAAVAVGDQQLCEQLLDDLKPVADGCAVNAALVCFLGAHAHRIGRLHAALGQLDRAQDWLRRALAVHVTLGARAWEAETCAALAAYRHRLDELADDLADAELNHDIGHAARARDEREWIVAELRRSTRPGGGVRPLGATAAERARKAVSARIRDAIRRIAEVMPDLGTHLDRSVRTGTTCRYDP